MPVHSPVKKESVGLWSNRMGTKEIAKVGRPCSWECYEEKCCYSEIFFLEILINVKAGKVN
jgi:hypothetical protein